MILDYPVSPKYHQSILKRKQQRFDTQRRQCEDGADSFVEDTGL
jgi:hypothetical protein